MFASNVDPAQTPHNVASDLGLHYLQLTFLRVSSIEMANSINPAKAAHLAVHLQNQLSLLP